MIGYETIQGGVVGAGMGKKNETSSISLLLGLRSIHLLLVLVVLVLDLSYRR